MIRRNREEAWLFDCLCSQRAHSLRCLVDILYYSLFALRGLWTVQQQSLHDMSDSVPKNTVAIQPSATGVCSPQSSLITQTRPSIPCTTDFAQLLTTLGDCLFALRLSDWQKYPRLPYVRLLSSTVFII